MDERGYNRIVFAAVGYARHRHFSGSITGWIPCLFSMFHEQGASPNSFAKFLLVFNVMRISPSLKMNTPEQSLSVLLKSETRLVHQHLERIPYFEMLGGGGMKLENYVAQLKAFAVIIGTLESELNRCRDGRVQTAWADCRPKLPWLLEDLAYFSKTLIFAAPGVVRQAISMSGKIRLNAAKSPISLLGCLYVFEGAGLGAEVLRGQFEKQLGLESGKGSRYLLGYGADLHEFWNAFRARIDSQKLNAEEQKAVIEAALMCFSSLGDVMALCHPLEAEQGRYDIADLNPEAGYHAVPEDPREVLAAIEAGRHSLGGDSYLSARYGERGERFTRSDAAWLASLCDLEQEAVNEQVRWLSRLLAARGIPTIFMEHHLLRLAESLGRAVPEKRSRYGKLTTAAKDIRITRENRMTHQMFLECATRAERNLAAINPDLAEGLGEILVSALIDEAEGFEGARESLLAWLTDGDRFPEEWCRAVNGIVSETESLIHSTDENTGK